MANELNLDLGPARTGLTLTVVLLLDGVVFGDPLAVTELSPGFYSATMPTGTPGLFSVRFMADTILVGQGTIDWDGTAERFLATVPDVASVGFTTERDAALVSANAAALAVADGRHKIDYLNSAAIQYDADGNVRTTFDLLDVDGNPATTAQTAVERVPQP